MDTPPQKDSQSQQEQTSESQKKQRAVSKADVIKFAGLLLFIVLLVIVGITIIPYYDQFTTEEGRLSLIEQIHSAGIYGVLVCLGLQFVQIVVAFIPGEVIQLAIGATYGPLAGTAVTTLGALISSIFVFCVVRRLGAPFVQGMIGNKHSKILDFFDNDSRLNAMVFILFLIPGLPKDVFTYLFPLSKIRPLNFFLLSTLGRIPGIAASAFIGSSAMQGDYIQAIIVGIITGVLGLLGIIFNKQIIGFGSTVEKRVKRKAGASTKEPAGMIEDAAAHKE